MYWANFLHIYQPPTQKKYWVDKITRESYRPVFTGLLKIPQAKVVLNINAVLAELLIQYGHHDVIAAIRQLAEAGQLEFTASAKYHPLLPRLPKAEVVRQIKLNEATNRKIFGEVYQPKGFFPPEMAFSIEVAGIVRELGYKWIIVDELSFPKKSTIDYTTIYTIKGLKDFQIYFRERNPSNTILAFQLTDPAAIIKSLDYKIVRHEYLLTAMDGETFGHHRLGLEQVLFDLYRSPSITSTFISELPALFSKREAIVPQPSTWALMHKDLERKQPFSRWDDPENEIHQLQWQLLRLAVRSVQREEKGMSNERRVTKPRKLLDQAVHSDQFWWAGAKPWWSIEYIEAGAMQLKDTIKACQTASERTKQRAEELYIKIVTTAFNWQRSGKVDELSKQEDEEIRQRVDRALPQMKGAEFSAMIASLESQRDEAAKRQEYERAAQFRDRIAELKEHRGKLKKSI